MSGKDNHRSAVSLADLESDISNAPLAAEAIEGLDSRACIHIHSVRKRDTDPDGVSAKAAIDGVVKAGILPDDSTEFIKEVSYSQEKAAEEKTVITITFSVDRPI